MSMGWELEKVDEDRGGQKTIIMTNLEINSLKWILFLFWSFLGH